MGNEGISKNMEATVVLSAVGFGFRVQGGKGMKQYELLSGDG